MGKNGKKKGADLSPKRTWSDASDVPTDVKRQKRDSDTLKNSSGEFNLAGSGNHGIFSKQRIGTFKIDSEFIDPNTRNPILGQVEGIQLEAPSGTNNKPPDLNTAQIFYSSSMNPKTDAEEKQVGSKKVWTHNERVATLFGLLRSPKVDLAMAAKTQGPHTFAHEITSRTLEAATAYKYKELVELEEKLKLSENTGEPQSLALNKTSTKVETLTMKQQAENLLTNMDVLVLSSDQARKKMSAVAKAQKLPDKVIEAYSSMYTNLYNTVKNRLNKIKEGEADTFDQKEKEMEMQYLLARYRQLLEIEPYASYAYTRKPNRSEMNNKGEGSLNSVLKGEKDDNDIMQLDKKGIPFIYKAIDIDDDKTEIPEDEMIEFGTRKLAFILGPKRAAAVVTKQAKDLYG